MCNESSPFGVDYPIGWESMLHEENPWRAVCNVDLANAYCGEVTFDGTFAWLEHRHLDGLIRESVASRARKDRWFQVVESLTARLAAKQLQLPKSLTTFFLDRALVQHTQFEHVRPTGLETIIWPRNHAAAILRIFEESQASLFWYLYLSSMTEEIIISAEPLSPANNDGDHEFTLPKNPTLVTRIWRCPIGFEELVFRFWLEQQILGELRRGEPLSRLQTKYYRIISAALVN